MDRLIIWHNGNTNNKKSFRISIWRRGDDLPGVHGEAWKGITLCSVILNNSVLAPNLHSSLSRIRELRLAWPTLWGNCFKTNYVLCNHVPDVSFQPVWLIKVCYQLTLSKRRFGNLKFHISFMFPVAFLFPYWGFTAAYRLSFQAVAYQLPANTALLYFQLFSTKKHFLLSQEV